MRYWKGNKNTIKEGQCGTMSNNGSVPDSTEINKQEYIQYTSIQSKKPPVVNIIEFEDVETGKIYRLKEKDNP